MCRQPVHRPVLSAAERVLARGEDLQPDLARRLASEAVEAAQRVLSICIRALDYLPPVDITFGDYLRALITADKEFFPEDTRRYRLAFIQAFRDHGIYPLDIRTLAEDTLPWSPIDAATRQALRELLPPPEVLHTMAYAYDASSSLAAVLGVEEDDEEASLKAEIWQSFRDRNPRGAVEMFLREAWLPTGDFPNAAGSGGSRRFRQFQLERLGASFLHGWIHHQAQNSENVEVSADMVAWHFGLDVRRIARGSRDRGLRLEVHAVRPTLRLRPDGRSKVELLVMLTQQERRDLPRDPDSSDPMLDEEGLPLSFKFRGGCTLIIDPDEGCLRFAIGKNLLSPARFGRHAAFLRQQIAELGDEAIELFELRPQAGRPRRPKEPFALLHRSPAGKGGY